MKKQNKPYQDGASQLSARKSLKPPFFFIILLKKALARNRPQ